MAYERPLVFLVSLMGMILSCSGFVAERSVNIPATFPAASSLEIEQKVTTDHTSMKTEVTGFDKILQISDTKKSTKAVEQTSPGDAAHERKPDFISENIKNEMPFAKIIRDAGLNAARENAMTDSVTSVPRNVILLFAEAGQDRDDFWKVFKSSHSFPVEGLLQNCHVTEIEAARFPLESRLVPGNRFRTCACEPFLRSNIAALLFWARGVKGMTTGSFSNANFTIPSLFGYEETVAVPREVDEAEENNVKPEIHKLKPEIHSDWHGIDLGKQPNRVSPSVSSPINREDAAESMWNVLDMFSKIRISLFRSLLESLGGNVATPEDSTPSRKSHRLRSNLADIIEELKPVESEKGFILVATLSARELNSVLKLLQRDVSEETLLVVSGVCNHDAKPVPFFAQGSSSKMLHEAITVWDLPTMIWNIIANGCQGSGCRLRRHDTLPLALPVAQLKSIPRNGSATWRISRDAAEKSDRAAKKADSNTKDTSEKDEEKNETMEDQVRSSSNFKKAEKFTTIFGTLVSMVTAFTLAS